MFKFITAFVFAMLITMPVLAVEPDTVTVWVGPSTHTWQGQVRAIHQSPTHPTFQFHSNVLPTTTCIKRSQHALCGMQTGQGGTGLWTLFFFVNDDTYIYEGCRALEPDLLFDFLADFGFDIQFICA